MDGPSPVAHCQVVIYVACREGHNSFANHGHALWFPFIFIWDPLSRKGECADIQSLKAVQRNAFEALMAREEPIVMVSTANQEHSMDTIRWRAALM